MLARARLCAAYAAALLAAPAVTSLTLASASVPSGSSTTGTVQVSGATFGRGSTVVLTSTDTHIATVPASVTVSSTKGNSTPFTVRTAAGAGGCTSIVANMATGGIAKRALLTVLPPAPSGQLRVTLSSPSVPGGFGATGTVSLVAVSPIPSTTVTLASSTPDATVPATVTLPPGAPEEGGAYRSIVNFPITTRQVGFATCASITATAGPSTAHALLGIAGVSG